MSAKIKILSGILAILTLTALCMYDIISMSFLLSVAAIVGIVVFVHDCLQTKHLILRNYPLVGRFRFLFEKFRPEIQQYFVEDNINGAPFNRENRSDIYQKAKKDSNTVPFGTQLDVYKEGYEHIKHSLYPLEYHDIAEPRNLIGSKFCKFPYSASILNISAMSFGALSKAAVMAMNGGAKLGGFYQNTGEGGLSPYHLEYGADICFQIGTGYFGAGKGVEVSKGKFKRYFDDEAFKINALRPEVKMVEIKLSQGAKPGHGGVLPARKNTEEISAIRGTIAFTEVLSPAYHTAFTDAETMVNFIKHVRELCGYKPVGIKLCLGDIKQFEELVKTMKAMDCYPDFMTLDGAEGGTGAAPLVFANHVGTPLLDALVAVNKVLLKYDMRKDIKVLASGKVASSFDIIKLLSLGADGLNAARAFMLSLGCIQARECDQNTCPVGIATQDPILVAGLNPGEKRVRVFNFHKEMIEEVCELMGALGVDNVKKLNASMIEVRHNGAMQSYAKMLTIYPFK